jgi:hypothetical protein
MASATMPAAARSFTDPPGLTHSALASTSTPSEFRVMRWKRNSGVLPILWSRLCPKALETDMSFRAASFIGSFDEKKRRADDQSAVKLGTVSYVGLRAFLALGSVSDEEAKKTYAQGWTALKPYLRIVPQTQAVTRMRAGAAARVSGSPWRDSPGLELQHGL